jgi:uncharacterized protein YcnI
LSVYGQGSKEIIMRNLSIIALLLLAGPATAHVVAVPATGTAGTYNGLVLRVGHGCGAAATTAIRVELPPGLTVVRPQPKPGWTLAIERVALPSPVMVEGKSVTDRVAAITWSGNLPADHFDDFGLLIKLPGAAGRLQLPVEQRCGTTIQRWDGADPRQPPPSVEIAPSASSGHDH